jgi:outer membrane protein assembly factor BamD (BamD/ComL family)
MEASLIRFLVRQHIIRRRYASVITTLNIFKSALCIFAMACLLVTVSPVLANQVVLDEIKIKETETTTVVDVLFGLPLEYLKHFPQKTGEILQIQLSLKKEEHREIHKEVREGGELLTPDGKKSVLVYVTYEEGVPGGPYLTLRFSQQVHFDVSQGPDRRSLRVNVTHEAVRSGKGIKTGKSSSAKTGNVDSMMAKARQAITFGNNKGAIDLLRRILRLPKNEHTQEANELLGLALERDKQIPRAKYEYKKYLKRYPEGEGADRVKQRLASLRDLRIKAKRKLRRSKRVRKKSLVTTFGRFTQGYSEYYLDRELEGDAEAQEQELQQKILNTNFSIKSRYRGKDRTIQAVFNASHIHDYLAGDPGREDDDENESDVRRMYVDIDDQLYGYTGRVGRQTSRNGGVFGTFDGVVAGYHVSPRWLVSAMFGKPVFHSFFDTELPEKVFYGVKADVESSDKKLGSNMFFVQQEVDGILDRQAVGADLRYARKGLSIFGLLDYDVSYSELSLFNLRIGWNYTDSNKLNFSYNRRNLVMTSQAANTIPGITTIDQLEELISESEIREIAQKRTVVNQTLTIGNSYQYSKQRQLNVDVTLLHTAETPAVANPLGGVVDGYGATDQQFIYSLQFISSDTFVARDLYVLGMRRSDFDTYTDNSAYINARIPLLGKWRTGLRLNVSKRDSESFGKRTTISPVVKLSYRLSRAWSFDAELGMDFVDNVGQPDEERRRMRLSYAYTF